MKTNFYTILVLKVSTPKCGAFTTLSRNANLKTGFKWLAL